MNKHTGLLVDTTFCPSDPRELTDRFVLLVTMAKRTSMPYAVTVDNFARMMTSSLLKTDKIAAVRYGGLVAAARLDVPKRWSRNVATRAEIYLFGGGTVSRVDEETLANVHTDDIITLACRVSTEAPFATLVASREQQDNNSVFDSAAGFVFPDTSPPIDDQSLWDRLNTEAECTLLVRVGVITNVGRHSFGDVRLLTASGPGVRRASLEMRGMGAAAGRRTRRQRLALPKPTIPTTDADTFVVTPTLTKAAALPRLMTTDDTSDVDRRASFEKRVVVAQSTAVAAHAEKRRDMFRIRLMVHALRVATHVTASEAASSLTALAAMYTHKRVATAIGNVVDVDTAETALKRIRKFATDTDIPAPSTLPMPTRDISEEHIRRLLSPTSLDFMSVMVHRLRTQVVKTSEQRNRSKRVTFPSRLGNGGAGADDPMGSAESITTRIVSRDTAHPFAATSFKAVSLPGGKKQAAWSAVTYPQTTRLYFEKPLQWSQAVLESTMRLESSTSVPTPTTIDEAPRLFVVEERDHWVMTQLTTLDTRLQEQGPNAENSIELRMLLFDGEHLRTLLSDATREAEKQNVLETAPYVAYRLERRDIYHLFQPVISATAGETAMGVRRWLTTSTYVDIMRYMPKTTLTPTHAEGPRASVVDPRMARLV